MGLFAAKMADGMGKDQNAGGEMEPGTTTFESFESWCNDREGDGIHKKQFFVRYKN